MQLDIRKFKSFPTFKRRFLKRISTKYFTKEYENKCWLWIGDKHKQGYGYIKWGNQRYRTHRISYLIFNGLIPYDKEVRHKCNNSSCINPKHLLLGNHSDNMIDMIKANTRCNQKLNEEAVKVIKWMLKYKYKRGLITKLAKLYKVAPPTIGSINTERNWGWIKV
jgi:hypothetical protein